jgi:hypothetical protein
MNRFFFAVFVFVVMVFSSTFVSAQTTIPTTLEQVEQICLEQCGAPTWEIAVPIGGVPELTREGDTLRVSIMKTPSGGGPIVLWTAEMPAHPDGSATPDPEWLRDQPFTVVLEWTTSSTGLTYTPPRNVEVVVGIPVSSGGRVGMNTQPARVDCNCEQYHERERETIPSDSLVWELKPTSERALLHRVQSQCVTSRVTSREFSYLAVNEIGWVEVDGNWRRFNSSVLTQIRNSSNLSETFSIRSSDCPPPTETSEGSGETATE